jgi:DTW domain-containing protein YfiP
MKVSMTDETPDFVCRGCGYHEKNCVCAAQKSIKEAVVSGITLLKNGIAKMTHKPYYHIHEDVVM